MWSYARAAFLYEGAARHLVLQLKYADRLEHARFLSERLCYAGHDIISSHSLIVPVPSHWRRRLARRYNQAAILAQAVGRRTGCEYMPDALFRPYATNRLSGFSRTERYREMADAIAVKPHRKKSIVGRHVVLVDDLLTSGATATACAQALLDGGAMSVSLLVVALVPMQKERDLDLPLSDTT